MKYNDTGELDSHMLSIGLVIVQSRHEIMLEIFDLSFVVIRRSETHNDVMLLRGAMYLNM
jgi:hypothetical protein